jgi:hypothetical protein
MSEVMGNFWSFPGGLQGTKVTLAFQLPDQQDIVGESNQRVLNEMNVPDNCQSVTPDRTAKSSVHVPMVAATADKTRRFLAPIFGAGAKVKIDGDLCAIAMPAAPDFVVPRPIVQRVEPSGSLFTARLTTFSCDQRPSCRYHMHTITFLDFGRQPDGNCARSASRGGHKFCDSALCHASPIIYPGRCSVKYEVSHRRSRSPHSQRRKSCGFREWLALDAMLVSVWTTTICGSQLF